MDDGDTCDTGEGEEGDGDEEDSAGDGGDNFDVAGTISGALDRLLVSTVGSVEVTCGEGLRCSDQGVCETVDGTF